MDIAAWLEGTTHREPPPHLDQVDNPLTFQRREDEPEHTGRRYRGRKRKRASRDSSIIAPDPDHRHARTDVRQKSHNRANSRNDYSVSSRHSRGSRSTHDAYSHVHEKTYERRPRHKTKHDRYEPKSKPLKKDRNLRSEKKSDSKRRRSHRSDGHQTTGLIQSFNLKDRPKNSRLTLKHDAGAGLFRHGRASVQMTGRGNGLPDLVFNEMNFLQRPTEHQDEPANDDSQRHASKTGRKREPEEDKSAYFTKSKVPHVEHSETANKRQKKSRAIEKAEADQKVMPQTRTRQKTPPIELPQKPFLGFGGKGVQPENKRSRKESPEYFSWSESVPARKSSQIPVKQQDGHHLSQSHSRHGDVVSNPAPNAAGRNRTKRGRGPVRAQIGKRSVAESPRDRKQDTSRTRTTMQSLPRQGGRHGADKTSNSERVPSGYRTSEILDILEPRQATIDQTMAYRHALESVEGERTGSDKENNDPNSSIDKLLNQAQEALEKHSSRASKPEKPSRHRQEEFVQYRNLQSPPFETAVTSTTHSAARNQLSERIGVQQSHNAAEVPQNISVGRHQLPSNFGSRSGMRGSDRHIGDGWDRNGGPYGARERLFTHPDDDDDEMLDNGAGVGLFRFADNHTYGTGHQPEDFVFQSESVPAPGIIDSQAERVEEDSQFWSLMSGRMVSNTPSTRAVSIGGQSRSERLAGLHQEVGDCLAGFWKPNKLY